jgi:hypothetical protein
MNLFEMFVWTISTVWVKLVQVTFDDFIVGKLADKQLLCQKFETQRVHFYFDKQLTLKSCGLFIIVSFSSLFFSHPTKNSLSLRYNKFINTYCE